MSDKGVGKHKLDEIELPSTFNFYKLLHKLQHEAMSPNDMFVTLQKLQIEIDRQNTIALRWVEEAEYYERLVK